MRILPVLFVIAMSCSPAFGWGCQGHELVALTAWQFMNSHARQQVQQVLSAYPADASMNHFCGKFDKDLPLMAQMSTWADDYRNIDKKSGPWHYLDVPLGKKVGDGLSQYCEEGCVTTALRDQGALLKGPPSAEQANALRFLIHFVGDLHQPLHIADNHDQGGNCVPVQYLNAEVNTNNGHYTPVLHSIWDTALVLEAMHAALMHDDDIEKYSQRLIRLATQNRADWEKGSVVDWEIAAHELAEHITYGELKPTQTVPNLFAALAGPADMKRCSDNHYDRTLYELGLKIDYTYVDHAVNAVELQMAKAGLRLAKMLNETWPDTAANSSH